MKKHYRKVLTLALALLLAIGATMTGPGSAMADSDTYTASNGTDSTATFKLTDSSTGATYGGFCCAPNLPWAQGSVRYNRPAVNDPAAVAAAIGVSEEGLAKIRYAIAEMQSNYIGDTFSVADARMSFPRDTLTMGRPLSKLLTQYLVWAQLSMDKGGPGYVDFKPTAAEQDYFYRDTLQLTDTLGVEIVAPDGYALNAEGFMGPFTLQYTADSAASLKELDNLGLNKDISPTFKVQIANSALLYDNNDNTGNVLDGVQLGQAFYIKPKLSGSHTVNLVPQSTVITGIKTESVFSAGAAYQPLLSEEFNFLAPLEFPYDKPDTGLGLSKDVTQWTGSVTGNYASELTVSPDSQALFRVEVDSEPGDMNLFFGTPPTTSDDGYTLIYTPSQLAQVASDPSGKYRLMNNIDMANYITFNPSWGPIGNASAPFTGIFDGNGYTITNVTFSRFNSNYVALFGYSTGTIQNLSLSNINIVGSQYVGALVGELDGGTVTNCTVSNSTVNGYWLTGGAIGYAVATTGKTLSNITVTDTDVLCSANWGGGIVGGAVYYTLQNLKANNVKVTIDPPDSMSQINGCGGIAGTVQNGSILDCISSNVTLSCTAGNDGYYSTNYSYNAEVGGIVGYWYRGVTGTFQIARCSVTGLDLSAWEGVGGIAGIVVNAASGANCMVVTNCSVSDDSKMLVYGNSYGYGSNSNGYFYIFTMGGIVGGSYNSASGSTASITQCYAGAQQLLGPRTVPYNGSNDALRMGPYLGRDYFSTFLTVSNCQNSGTPAFAVGPNDPAAVGASVTAASNDALWARGVTDGYITDAYTATPDGGSDSNTPLTTADMLVYSAGAFTPISTFPVVGDGETNMINVVDGVPFHFYYKTDPLPNGEYVNAVTLNGNTETAKVTVKDTPPPTPGTAYYVDVVKYDNSVQKTLDGSEFTLYQYSGAGWTGTPDPVTTITPNSNGRVEITSPGWYALRETTTPSGYVEDNTYYNFYFNGTDFTEDSNVNLNGNWFSYLLGDEAGTTTETFMLYNVNHSIPPVPGTGSLELVGTKIINGGGPLTEGEFHFTVSEGSASVATGTSHDNGSIGFSQIKYTEAGDHTYVVSEDSPGSDWRANTSPITVYVRVTDPGGGAMLQVACYSDAGFTKPITDMYAYLAFTNTSTSTSGFDFTFYKRAPDDTPLVDVQFSLTPCANDGAVSSSAETTTCASISGGKVTFSGLASGTYLLQEIKTLPGYALPSGKWIVTVDADAGTVTFKAIGSPMAFSHDSSNDYILYNYKKPWIPFSGGWGVIVFTVGGVLLACLAFWLLLSMKKHRKVQNSELVM